MTVVVNAVAAKMGGAATYIRELAAELARAPEAGHFIFFVPPEQAEVGQSLPPHIEWRVTRAGHAGALRRLWWDQVTLRRILRRERATVLFSTGNFAMFFPPAPQALLVRNSLYFSRLYRGEILPRKPWRFRVSFQLRTWLVRLSLRQADTVMVPSQTLLEEMQASGAVLPARVRVNHYGTRLATGDSSGLPESPPPTRPFRLLFPSLYTEHKNLATVLMALKRLREQDHLEVQFTTTADPASEPARRCVTAPADQARAQDPAIASSIRFVPPGTPTEASRLYRECDAVVYPTLVESFGHPLVESLASGLPVVASDIPINRELGGSVPLYFQPLDAGDLAEKILRLAQDPGLRQRLAAAGRERARAYTWTAHVARLRALLAETLGSKP